MGKKGQFHEHIFSRIKKGEYPLFDIVVEFVKILEEESQHEKYSNQKQNFQRSVTTAELDNRLKNYGINTSRYNIGRVVTTLLKMCEIVYLPKNRGSNSSCYSQVTYSYEKLKELMELIEKVRGEKIMSGITDLFS